MPARVSADEIERELRDLSSHLRSERTFTLFGGCCMSVRGFKDTTKDTDAIVEPPTGYGYLKEDLRKAGFAWLENEAMVPYEAAPADQVVGDWDTFWRGEFNLDLFNPEAIFGMFSFSRQMHGRTRAWFNSGPLRVQLADPSTMFLFKSITGRWRHPGQAHRDLEDLETMLDRGEVDLAWVGDEWRRQIAKCRHPHRAYDFARAAVAHLRMKGYAIDWDPAPPEPGH